MSIQDVRIATVNFLAHFGDIKQNLARTESWAAQLASQDVEIICFPELSITGYSSKNEIKQFVQPVPGTVTDRLMNISSQYGVWLLVGLPEKDKHNNIYISQVVVSPEDFIGVYRKTILFSDEKRVYTPGSEIIVFKHRKITFGIQICYESRFSNVSTALISKGAELIFVPLGSLAGEPIAKKRKRFLDYLAKKAYNNSCYVACCNLICSQAKNAGIALIIDPKGEVITETVSKEEGAAITLLKG
ncbi:MAG: nitrilase-related carbon-nitrogen hydrolase [Promethearchaeota archaeon]